LKVSYLIDALYAAIAVWAAVLFWKSGNLEWIVVDEASRNNTAHLTNATLVWDPTQSAWEIDADRMVVTN
jgi:hypothetical protein